MKLPLRKLLWTAAAAVVLATVFMAYRDPHFMVAVAGLVMSCF
jgi:hypothetical protein